MKRRLGQWFASSLAAVFVSFSLGPVHAETAVGSTVESRILLGFKANDTAVGDMLPQGWNPVTLSQGPVGGANLIVALIDQRFLIPKASRQRRLRVRPLPCLPMDVKTALTASVPL